MSIVTGARITTNPKGIDTLSLPYAATASQGVYKDGNLVRTLFSAKELQGGNYPIYFDEKDDNGNPVSRPYTIKTKYNNIQVPWSGVVGNTSTNLTGDNVWRTLDPPLALSAVSDRVLVGVGYSEGYASQKYFLNGTPQVMGNVFPLNDKLQQNTDLVWNDGTTAYWAGYDSSTDTTFARKSFVFATTISSGAFVTFSSGATVVMKNGDPYPSCIDIKNDNTTSIPTGIAGNATYLFVAHKGLNQISVLTRSTGAFVRNLSFTAPGKIMIDGSHLWVIHSTNQVTKHLVAGDGTVGSALVNISGLTAPLSLARKDSSTISIFDGGNQQIFKRFNNSTGVSINTFGQTGGHYTSPVIANDRFLADKRNDSSTLPIPFHDHCYLADGSWWTTDVGNSRLMHYNSSDVFIEFISYIPRCYALSVDPNNTARFVASYVELEVNPKTMTWSLKYNWGANITSDYDDFQKIKGINTLSNGRTYGFLRKGSFNELVEFNTTTGLRFSGILFPLDNGLMFADGSIRSSEINSGVQYFYKRALTGFSGNNPVHGAKTVVEQVSVPTSFYPTHTSLISCPPTDSGVYAAFRNGLAKTDIEGEFRLGGVKSGAYTFRTFPATSKNYTGPYPIEKFDGGNHPFDSNGDPVGNAGNRAWTYKNIIVTGYNGEFWKNSQTNKYNVWTDDGLMLKQFGVTRPETTGEAPAMMAGNAIQGQVVEFEGSPFWVHNDEGQHQAIHIWPLNWLNSIHEINITIS